MITLPTLHDDDLSRVKVIASDMDCTLLADDGSMPPHMFERIAALDEVGVIFCAASGRPSYTLHDMFEPVLDHAAYLSDNGAAIACRGGLIFKDLIDVPTYHELIDFSLADGRGFPTVCGIEACYVERKYRDQWDTTLHKFYKRIEYVDSFDTLTAEVNKYTVFFPNNDGEDIYAETYRDRWGADFTVTNAGKQWIDIMNKHVDKGQGLAHLCEYLGVSMDDALALGDTYNDIPMLKAAGHGYIVANSEDHMQAHANFQAPSNNERGVAQVIDAVLAAHGVTPSWA